MRKTGLITLAAVLLTSAALAEKSRPNIVLILADDMGFSDVGCYGSEIATPNLDRLADGGIRFSQFYNTGRCCPTRASLLTGLYSHQTGIGHMTHDFGYDSYRGALNDRCKTIAEVLRPAGYFTAITGKWHVGSKLGERPLQRGFDRFYGVSEGGGFYYKLKKGRTIRLGDEVVGSFPDKPLPDDFYSTDAWTSYGIQFIDEALEQQKPFFLYLAHNAPHFPLEAPLPLVEKHRGRYTGGWDALREKRHSNQLANGIFRKPWELSDRPEKIPDWDSLSNEQHDNLDNKMAAYAATIDALDQSVGRVIDALGARGILDNTLILFLSDNGSSPEGGILGKSEDGLPMGAPLSGVYLGTAWANASNTPFRYHKSRVHEGGIATPLIAHWPAGIKTPGRTSHQPGHVIDILPTLSQLGAASYPESAPALEGNSLVPILTDDDNPPVSRSLFWEHEGNRAVRIDDWKLVALNESPWELYDLSNDRTERENLAEKHPEHVAELKAAYDAWAEKLGVLDFSEAKKGKL